MKTKSQILNTLSRLDIKLLKIFKKMMFKQMVELNDDVRAKYHEDMSVFFSIKCINADNTVDLIALNNDSMTNLKITDLKL